MKLSQEQILEQHQAIIRFNNTYLNNGGLKLKPGLTYFMSEEFKEIVQYKDDCQGRNLGPKGKTCLENNGIGCCKDEPWNTICKWV